MVVLDRFSGDGNPEDWIYRAERYFTFLGFFEEHWLPLPSLYLDGEALEWFRWMFRNNQFFDWNHFKEKLAQRFPKRTYAKSSVVDTQLTNILALLQKLEDKYSFVSPQVRVKDTRISAALAFSKGIASPLVEEKSSLGDNVEDHLELCDNFVGEHSSHVDHMFDEMSNEVFTKELEETSSTSSFLADSKVTQSSKVFNELLHCCCPKTIAEVQFETTIKLVDEAPCPEHSALHLFDECSLRNRSRRYTTNTSLALWLLALGSGEQKIVFETFDAKYLPELSLEPEITKDLYPEKFFVKVEDRILPSNIPSDEMLLVVENGTTMDGFNAHNILCPFPFNPSVNSSIVSVREILVTLCVWDPGIYLNSMDPLQLLGFTDEICFINYANSVNQVWDPGQQRCMHSSILLCGVLVLAVVTSLNFSFWDTFAKWGVADEMAYSVVNHVFTNNSLRIASREIQPIAPLGIIRLSKLFLFLQQQLAQLIGDECSFQKKISEQTSALQMALEGKEVAPIPCTAWQQGCVKSTTNLAKQMLHNFSRLEEIMIFFGTPGVPASYATCSNLEFEYILVGYGAYEFIILSMHDISNLGDNILDRPPTFSLLEFVALQTCESDHWSWAKIEGELELVKGASIVVAYAVHSSMLSEGKNTSIFISCGKFKATTRAICYLACFGCHRRVDECTVAPQNQLAELKKEASGAASGPYLLPRSRACLVIILEWNHQ